MAVDNVVPFGKTSARLTQESFEPFKAIDNVALSDLWFNHDHSAYAPTLLNERDDYDCEAMLIEAETFLVTAPCSRDR